MCGRRLVSQGSRRRPQRPVGPEEVGHLRSGNVVVVCRTERREVVAVVRLASGVGMTDRAVQSLFT